MTIASEKSTVIDWQSSPSMTNSAVLTYTEPPKSVGWWVMPGGTDSWKTKFGAYKKPNFLVRFSMKYVFGWTWEDAKEVPNV